MPLAVDPWQVEMLERMLQDKDAITRACGVPATYFGFDPGAPGGDYTAFVRVMRDANEAAAVWVDAFAPQMRLRFYPVINLELVDGVWCRR